MTDQDRTRWDARYAGDAPVRGTPNRWLASQAAQIDAHLASCSAPPHALDLACGAGGSLLWLAARGWQVTGVDVSEAALGLARTQFAAAGLLDRATLCCADLDAWRPAPASYDLITCFYFLDRRLWPSLRAAVRPGGLLVMQTFHTGQLAVRPQTDPAHLLAPGELSALLTNWGWRVLAAETTAFLEAVLGVKG
jgi:SAM-dependent methyltransferase